jgi:hypothetical protein
MINQNKTKETNKLKKQEKENTKNTNKRKYIETKTKEITHANI